MQHPGISQDFLILEIRVSTTQVYQTSKWFRESEHIPYLGRAVTVPGRDRINRLVHKLPRLSPASRNQYNGKTSDGEKGREVALMPVGTGGPFLPQEFHGESVQVDRRESADVNTWGMGVCRLMGTCARWEPRCRKANHELVLYPSVLYFYDAHEIFCRKYLF